MKLVLKILGVVILLMFITVGILWQQGIIVKQREINIVKIDCSKKDSLFQMIERRTLTRDSDDFKTMIENDYLNVEASVSFIKSCGSPRVKNISGDQADYLFLSIQHSPDHEVLSEYFATIKQMWLDGYLEVESFALMQDRYLIHEDKPQIFGTQYDSDGKIFEVDNMDSVKVRRRILGLEPLEEYMKKRKEVY